MLSWFAFPTADRPLGVTTAFENTAAISVDAMAGVVGMLCGAMAYVVTFPRLQGLINSLGDWGKITLPELTGISPWVFITALAIMALLLRVIAERRREIHP